MLISPEPVASNKFIASVFLILLLHLILLIITCRRGIALHCLYGQWSLSIGNSHLTEQRPLNRSIQKFEKFITSAGPPSRSKFIMIGRGVAAPHIGEIYGPRGFVSGDLLGKLTADPERSSPTYYIYISIDAVSAKDVPFVGLIDMSHPIWELSPNNPSFSGRQWASLNVYGRISAQ
jgi:hypothetical protein